MDFLEPRFLLRSLCGTAGIHRWPLPEGTPLLHVYTRLVISSQTWSSPRLSCSSNGHCYCPHGRAAKLGGSEPAVPSPVCRMHPPCSGPQLLTPVPPPVPASPASCLRLHVPRALLTPGSSSSTRAGFFPNQKSDQIVSCPL
jgi:hypothetical protein